MDATRKAIRRILSEDSRAKQKAKEAISAIVDHVRGQGGIINPLNPRELVFLDGEGDPVIGVELHAWHDGIDLQHIRSFQPGAGSASFVLRTVTEIADEHGVPMMLIAKPTATPTGVKGLTKRQLVSWYKRHGFKPWPEYQGMLRREPKD